MKMSTDLSYPNASEGMTFHVRGKKLSKQGQDKIDAILADTPVVSFGTRQLVVEACKQRTTSGVCLSKSDADFYLAVLNQIAAGLRPSVVFENFKLTYREFRGILDRDQRLMDLYKKTTELGQEARALLLEDELIKRAVEGEIEDVYHKGKVVGKRVVKSDSLLTTAVKAHSPDRYADRSVVDHGGTVLQLHIEGVRRGTPDAIDVTPTKEGTVDEEHVQKRKDRAGSPVLQTTRHDAEPHNGEADNG